MKTRLSTLIAVGIGFGLALLEAALAKTAPSATPAPVAPASTAPLIVASEVAGFTTLDVASASQADQPQLSLGAIGLVNHAAYMGVASSVNGRTLVDKNATWAENQFNASHGTPRYYVEITNGPLAGASFDIAVTSAKHHSLTLVQALPAHVGAKPGYVVRPHWTLASLFGTADAAGLQSGPSTAADLISIYNGRSYDQYFYSIPLDGESASAAAIGTGWRRIGKGDADESVTPIYPDDGLLISRVGTEPVQIMLNGVVKTDRTLIPIQHGLNIVPNAYQAPLSLSTSNLHTGNPATGVRAGETAATADNVEIFNGTGYDIYYYQSSVRNGSGWRSSKDAKTDASKTAIAVGSSFAILRRGSAGFNWFAPAP